jgi:hypothetical protein
MAIILKSYIEVPHEMFIVSSDSLRAVVTKSTQGRRHRPDGTGMAALEISWSDATGLTLVRFNGGRRSRLARPLRSLRYVIVELI